MKNGAGHRIAFYAPMKSPRHPVPSGDREMARNLITRLEATGAAVSLCSELRIFDKTGSAQTQETLRAKAQAEIGRILNGTEQHATGNTPTALAHIPQLL